MKVTKKAQRPARMDGTCFYCNQKIGDDHKKDCVTISKQVLVKMTVRYVRSVPANWDKKQIESFMNEGSWCSSNALNELKAMSCICPITEFEYIRDESGPFLEE